MSPELSDDLQLISYLLDGGLDEEGFEKLERRLSENPATRSLYYQAIDQEVELGCSLHGDAGQPSQAPARRYPPLALFGLAGIALAALFAFIVLRDRDPSPPGDGAIAHTPDPPTDAGIPARRAIPPGPPEWVARFEDGVPLGWQGTFVTEGLPSGSRGAIGMTDVLGGQRTYRNIVPPPSQDPGHVRVADETHIHLICKLQHPGDIGIFLLAHVPDPTRDDGCLYQFRFDEILNTPGGWQRVSIPLSAFRRKDQQTHTFGPGGPEEGEVIWQLFFSATDPDADLLIDTWEVLPFGPGIVEVNNLAPSE